jgi:hypothetical protein
MFDVFVSVTIHTEKANFVASHLSPDTFEDILSVLVVP